MLAIPARTWKRFKSYLTLHNRALKICFQCRRVYLANKNFFIKSCLIVGYDLTSSMLQQHLPHPWLVVNSFHINDVVTEHLSHFMKAGDYLVIEDTKLDIPCNT